MARYPNLFDEIEKYLKQICPNSASAKEIYRNLKVKSYYAVLWRCKFLADEGIIKQVNKRSFRYIPKTTNEHTLRYLKIEIIRKILDVEDEKKLNRILEFIKT